MKIPSTTGVNLCAAALIILPVLCAMEKERQLGISRLLQDAPTVGIGFTATSTATSADASVSSSIEDELVEALESDDQVTVVGEIQLGELLCDSLAEAEEASLLNFAIGASETIAAEKTSYIVMGGESFTDGIDRKVWTGKEAEDTIEGAHRTVSMTWGQECNVETFLLKVTTSYDDGRLFLTKSVPCEAGSSSEVCIVEVELDLNEPAELDTSTAGDESQGAGRRLREVATGKRELQTTTTTIDVMMLYTDDVKAMLGGVTDAQVESTFAAAIASSTEALTNSDIDAEFSLVFVGPLPYTETSTDSLIMIRNIQQNEAVAQLRACTGADLVQLVGNLNDGFCGRGYLFTGFADRGFSVVGANCFFNFSHTHEFGHNLGCSHNRENTDRIHEFAYGWRYCDGTDTYRTVMSYSNQCFARVVNYFSNPDVILYNKPTGQDDADNARMIKLNMPTVASFESPAADPSSCGSPTPTPPPFGLVDASVRTEVTVSANAYDERTSDDGGCDPNGCEPSKTRDSDLDSDSRWSCARSLEDNTCRLTFEFGNAQDIVEINIAFYKGDERTRTFKVKTWDTSGDTITTTFTSSGETNGFEVFSLGSDETAKFQIFPVSPNTNDWLSITEVEIMVL